MKILFLQDNAINESIPLMELSAYLKIYGHQTALLIEAEEACFKKEILKNNPDIVLIAAPVLAKEWVLLMAKRIKTLTGKKIILAGTYPTLFPEVIENENIDIVCRGEAEKAISQLLNSLEKKQSIADIENLWLKQDGKVYRNPIGNFIHSLEDIPNPDRKLYYDRYKFLGDFSLKRFISGRGCIHNCAYCFNQQLKKIYEGKGVYVRKKSVEKIISEIIWVKNNYRLKSLHFSDDIFPIDQSWVEEFSLLYKEQINIPFTCNSSVDLVTAEMVEALAAAGCSGIAIGIETGNEKFRKKILNKNITNQQIVTAGKLIKQHGMKLITFNMLNSPGETVDNALETIKLNKQIKADAARVTLSVCIPGTQYYDWTQKNEFSEPMDSNGKKKPEIVNYVWFNIFYLFEFFVKTPFVLGAFKKIILFPWPSWFKLFQLMVLFSERKNFKIPIKDAVIYLMHVKNPLKRTNVFPTLI